LQTDSVVKIVQALHFYDCRVKSLRPLRNKNSTVST